MYSEGDWRGALSVCTDMISVDRKNFGEITTTTLNSQFLNNMCRPLHREGKHVSEAGPVSVGD